jgi:hypothetical protein
MLKSFASSHCCPGWAIALHNFSYLTIFFCRSGTRERVFFFEKRKLPEQHGAPQPVSYLIAQ